MTSYTDIEQSRKLAEILPLESADMWWAWYSNPLSNGHYDNFPMFYKPVCNPDESVPCWSLAALLGVLQIYITPTAFSTNISVPSLTQTKNGYSITYVGDYGIMESPIEVVADNIVDACVEMIFKLHGLNLL